MDKKVAGELIDAICDAGNKIEERYGRVSSDTFYATFASILAAVITDNARSDLNKVSIEYRMFNHYLIRAMHSASVADKQENNND